RFAAFEPVEIGRETGLPQSAQPARQPAVDHVLLAGVQVDAGACVDQPAHALEIGGREDELSVAPLIEHPHFRGKRPVHALPSPLVTFIAGPPFVPAGAAPARRAACRSQPRPRRCRSAAKVAPPPPPAPPPDFSSTRPPRPPVRPAPRSDA